jgi:hypothetical protein
MPRIVSATRIQGGADSFEPRRAQWERPALRRLAANQAQNATTPCNDGSGAGCGPTLNHS